LEHTATRTENQSIDTDFFPPELSTDAEQPPDLLDDAPHDATIQALTASHPCLSCGKVHAAFACEDLRGFTPEQQKVVFSKLAQAKREQRRNNPRPSQPRQIHQMHQDDAAEYYDEDPNLEPDLNDLLNFQAGR
jgi:hypothetical protein